MKKYMKVKIIKTGDLYDSDEILFVDDKGNKLGTGFLPKEKDSTIALTKCPMCRKENYVMNVLSGQCSWCVFNVKDEEYEII